MTYLPVHIACENGRINILHIIQSYFQGNAPLTLDLHAVDEFSGENCALIACRQLNFTMIKFLHEHCKANFNVVNKRRENSIQLVMLASKRGLIREAIDCLRYLIETVNVDISYHHEESLLMAEDPQIIQVFENFLWEKGIKTRKAELERKNRLTPTCVTASQAEKDLKKYEGNQFQIKHLLANDTQLDGPSMISEIRAEDSLMTPLISTLIPFTEEA